MNVLLHNAKEFLVALDQALNVLICALTWRMGWSDETLSAHAWRSFSEGKLWGRLWCPVIDFLFSWQTDPDYPNTQHCQRAFLKEKDRRYLPPEYRESPEKVSPQ